MQIPLEEVFDVLARATAAIAPLNTHSFIPTTTYQEMVRKRLFRFLDEPTADAWEEIFSTPLGNGVAVWRAVADIDNTFTSHPPMNGQAWMQIPSAEAVFLAITTSLEIRADRGND